jgi:hypothetical protein
MRPSRLGGRGLAEPGPGVREDVDERAKRFVAPDRTFFRSLDTLEMTGGREKRATMPVLDTFSMQGRTSVITGSTRGLGRAFAVAQRLDRMSSSSGETRKQHPPSRQNSKGSGSEC